MKTALKITTLALAAGILFGCLAGIPFSSLGVPPIGLFVETTLNKQVVENKVGDKQGEACVSSILGLVTTGDASAATAARIGGISSISVVDYSFRNILNLYSRYCVIVRGS